jgi:sugar phosphate permease
MATSSIPSTAEPPDPRPQRPLVYYGYWILAAAFVAQFVAVGSASYVAGVFFKPMAEELDWTRVEYTYAQTLGRFVMAFAGFFIGVYVDRFGGRVMMVIGVTVLGAALFLTSQVTELWQWVLMRGAVFTVGAALMGNLVVNVTLSKWFVEKRGRVVAVAATGISLSGILLPPVMTIFIDEFGWRAGWRALAIGAWVLVYPVAMLMRRQPEDHGLYPDGKSAEEVAAGEGAMAEADYANSLTRREALHTSTLYLIVLSFGLGGVALGTLLLQTIPYLTDEGFSRRTAALMMSSFSFMSASAKPLWGYLIDRKEVRGLASVSFAGAAVAVLLIVVGATSGSIVVVAGAYMLAGLSYSGNIPLQEVLWASYFGRRYLGEVRSVALPLALVLGAGGPLMVSYYFDVVGNYHGAFIAVAGLSLVAALLLSQVRRPVKPGGYGPPAVAAGGP